MRTARAIRSWLLVPILASAVACSSVSESRFLHGQALADEGETLAHVYGETWGVYLFMLPIVAGSTSHPGRAVFGQDTVSSESVVDLVTAQSAKLGATKTLDPHSSTSTFWLWPIIQIKTAEASGNAIR
jgi:hypothetical protein